MKTRTRRAEGKLQASSLRVPDIVERPWDFDEARVKRLADRLELLRNLQNPLLRGNTGSPRTPVTSGPRVLEPKAGLPRDRRNLYVIDRESMRKAAARKDFGNNTPDNQKSDQKKDYDGIFR
jgi:hypothetical protein